MHILAICWSAQAELRVMRDRAEKPVLIASYDDQAEATGTLSALIFLICLWEFCQMFERWTVLMQRIAKAYSIYCLMRQLSWTQIKSSSGPRLHLCGAGCVDTWKGCCVDRDPTVPEKNSGSLVGEYQWTSGSRYVIWVFVHSTGGAVECGCG